MENKALRWIQRLSNFNRALAKLNEAVAKIHTKYTPDELGNISDDQFLDDILKEGLIQRFEYTHELAWKVMKDYLNEIGNVKTMGSKDATKEAFSVGLIEKGHVWMEMILSRNKTPHTYNEATADAIFFKILNDYHPGLNAFAATMEQIKSGEQGNLIEVKL